MDKQTNANYIYEATTSNDMTDEEYQAWKQRQKEFEREQKIHAKLKDIYARLAELNKQNPIRNVVKLNNPKFKTPIKRG